MGSRPVQTCRRTWKQGRIRPCFSSCREKIMPVYAKNAKESSLRVRRVEQGSALFRRVRVLEELLVDLYHRLLERLAKLVEILLVEEDLVFLVLVVAHAFALCNRDIEILFGFRRFHIEKVRPLSRAHPFREDLVL